MEWFSEDIQKVLIAALFGAIVGLEREWSGKPAGLRTLVLVSAGAALFTVVSFNLAMLDTKHEESDVTRIASNIVTGIGFIGAGIIFRGKGGVQGLTTAATVWICAAIGMTVGMGDYMLAGITTALVWGVLVLLQQLEQLLIKVAETVVYKVQFDTSEHRKNISYSDYFPDKNYKLIETQYHKKEGAVTIYWTVSSSRKKHEKAVEKLVRDNAITGLSYG